jgi:hypothetical protein
VPYQKSISLPAFCRGSTWDSRYVEGRQLLPALGRAGAPPPRVPRPRIPPELPRLRRRVVIEDFDLGGVVRHEIYLYRSSRVDCYLVEVDGRRLPGRCGRARVLELARKAFVRVQAPD